MNQSHTSRPGTPGFVRPTALFVTLASIVGCAANRTTNSVLPAPPWPAIDVASAELDPAAGTNASGVAIATEPWRHGIVARGQWARGRPVSVEMQRMTPIRHITIHHDGMKPFYGTDLPTVASHLELIRTMHRGKGWADIGYHFAIDRAGRVWEGRPLAFQGAHVKDHNQGNIGIVVLGNFEQQMPTDLQLDAVEQHILALQQAYGVSGRNIRTHREWPGASTICPGGRLQQIVKELRRGVKSLRQ